MCTQVAVLECRRGGVDDHQVLAGPQLSGTVELPEDLTQAPADAVTSHSRADTS